MPFRARWVRGLGCHFYFARRVTFQPCADKIASGSAGPAVLSVTVQAVAVVRLEAQNIVPKWLRTMDCVCFWPPAG
jgi:hypothetical protein